jgi:hypothetical protein
MRTLAAFSLVLAALGLIGCPADTKSSGRDLPAANVGAGGNAPANPSLKPVAPMPDFTGKPAAGTQPAATGAPGTVVKNPASMPTPGGTVIPGVTPPQTDNVIKGEATEVHHVKEYTYVKIKTAAGEVWAAVPKKETVAVGNQLTVQRDMWMTNFQSPSLGRSFERIAFGNLAN